MSFLLLVNILALLFSFFVVGAILGAVFSTPFREKVVRVLRAGLAYRPLSFTRSRHNPILKPGRSPWTAEAVLNPAAAVMNDRVHLIYRAIGMDGVSRLGYASSADGLVVDELLPYPIFVGSYVTRWHRSSHHQRYAPHLYPSGGSWGGYEDPRMVVIEGRVYVTFNMFDNWILRVGLITITEDAFLAKRFGEWRGPIILTHGTREKNWMLFPEKIRGQFAVLHSIIGDDPDHVRVELVDDLELLKERQFVSPDPQKIPDQPIAWHVHVRSAGPPPIKTDKGWLVFYHANDAEEPHRYKLGAMLLDLEDPTRILCRASAPVLSPDAVYENDGKPGIIYVCGAVVRDGKIFIYYGGADKVVCVATAPMEPFLNALTEGNAPEVAVQSAQTT